VRALETAGSTVRTLSRRASTPASAHQHFAGEIDDLKLLERAMEGVDIVFHMAALLHITTPSPSLAPEYRRINVGGTEAVVTAAREAGVQRLVALSSIAVYGSTDRTVDESTSTHPDTLYGSTKLAGERIVLTAVDEKGRPFGSVLRLAAVYGPSIKGNYERLVRAVARRRFVPIGSGRNARTLVFEDDVAQAMLLASVHPAAAGRVFNVTDGSIHTVAEILRAISAALGRRPPRLAVPLWMARTAIRSAETVCGAIGRNSPVTRATLHKYTENVAVSGERIRKELGFEPRWTLADGWRQTVERMRLEGRL
jgi:UDP-glucose 4-epimerase